MENGVAAFAAVPEEKRILCFTAVDTRLLLLEMTNPYVGEVMMDKRGLPAK